ncbi:PilC/PilY family type IV pilus protein [Nevskia sp.]|uniref:pilus assembly protein n=1 Tax=Nevskia sp. TaxID=1929292 RepID=UPI0025F66448|nr:PilC/PilY family type IV pilus protein [Nevskia sp.]
MTMRASIVRCTTVALLVISGSAQAVIPLSNAPLFLSTPVSPNVMLLFDNSGSMENIIWADGYNPSTIYADWSPRTCGNNSNTQCWTATDGNVGMSDIKVGGCSSGRLEGRPSGTGTRKCLSLPTPSGANTRYTGNYLNYLFATYASNSNLTTGTIPNETRLSAAKNVATGIVNANPTLRWGLARFNPPISGGDQGPGGKIVANCGSTPATVTSAINALAANSNTPLAETFYEITRYFRGLTSYYNTGTYTSPVQYRCQKNFVIVVTDGFPTYDSTFPTNDPDDLANSFLSLPNWDGKAPSTTSTTYPFFPRYSDGFRGQSGTSESQEAWTLYLDDLAKFAYDTDLKKSGNDLTGVSYEDATFKTQRIQTYSIGLAINNQMLQDAAEYGQGKSYTANNASQLQIALQNALNDIAARTSAAASIATNSTRLTADTAIYQARFATGDWSGQLLALPVRLDGTVGTPIWDAALRLPAAASRNILTYDPTRSLGNRGRSFLWTQLNSTQIAALNKDGAGTTDNNGQNRLGWLRGDRSNEGDVAPALRRRSATTVLGDIVNSDPAFAGQQDYGYARLPGTEGTSYTAFRDSAAYKARPTMVYVGANDGMLHGFRATDGVEQLAYVPDAVYSGLSAVSDQAWNQNHRYLVDGAVRLLDARVNGNWKTVLLGTLGGGGQSVFALDVTDPTSFGTSNVLWEFTPSSDVDMGYSYPQAAIVRLANDQWAALIANGYNSTNGKAVLYLVKLDDGSVIRKFDTGVGSDNGMSAPIPVDVDGDRVTDLIYAGDLKGNLWKIDLRGTNPAAWDFAFKSGTTPVPLYRACSADPCTTSNRQPITARAEVGIHPDGGYLVYFGTGSYFRSDYNTAGTVGNTFYAIRDADNGSAPPSSRASLLGQQVIATVTQAFGSQTEKVRATTNNTPTASQLGWYLNLPDAGERQVSTPILRGGAVIFTTLIPNTAACGFGGDSYLMEIDAVSGSRRATTPFDLNRDTAFNSEDQIVVGGVRMAVSGRQSKEGIIKTPAIITTGAFEVKLASGTTGGIDTTIEPPPSFEPGGRLSWRQMR